MREQSLRRASLLLCVVLVPGFASAQTAKPKTGSKAPAPPQTVAPVQPAVERHYYIAAEDVSWDFAPSQRDLTHNSPLRRMWAGRTKWEKTRFIEYTDRTFTKKKPQPIWLGILGPIIRGEVGDTIFVHFLNRSRNVHSIHSHGVRYDKDSEGAHYGFRGKGGYVMPQGQFTYKWLVKPESGPAPGEPSSRVWFYHGHVDLPEETNAGLIGPIVITAKGKAQPDATPMDVDREFVVLFMLFDQSPPPPAGTRRSQIQLVPPEFEFHSMNGFLYGNLQGLVMREGERVRWHVMALGSENDMHTPHWHGHTVSRGGQTKDVVQLLPAMTETVDMLADNLGTWMFECHVSDHLDEGMMTVFTVLPKERACPLEFRDGTFWKDNKIEFAVVNTGDRDIARSVNRLETIVQPFHLMSLTGEEGNTAAIKPKERIVRVVTGAPNLAQTTLGYVVVPEQISFADGSTWKPRYRGECAQPFFKDEASRYEMPVLPPNRAHEDDEFEDY